MCDALGTSGVEDPRPRELVPSAVSNIVASCSDHRPIQVSGCRERKLCATTTLPGGFLDRRYVAADQTASAERCSSGGEVIDSRDLRVDGIGASTLVRSLCRCRRSPSRSWDLRALHQAMAPPTVRQHPAPRLPNGQGYVTLGPLDRLGVEVLEAVEARCARERIDAPAAGDAIGALAVTTPVVDHVGEAMPRLPR
jgi:hypothetical protein